MKYRNIDERWGGAVEVTAADYMSQAKINWAQATADERASRRDESPDVIDIDERPDGIYVNGERVADTAKSEAACDNCGSCADDCHCGDYISTALPDGWTPPHDAHVDRWIANQMFGDR